MRVNPPIRRDELYSRLVREPIRFVGWQRNQHGVHQGQVAIVFAVMPSDALFVVRGWSRFELYDYIYGIAVGFILELACELVFVRGGHTR